ncbi:MAG: hypothetical protein EA365_14185 [Gloeocapsa sp. DLM2.Bin57]|nr:MAG: hypothetical protein EA365_14185 [Gloeocapsa sp. DLM2.Bin57]
MLYSLYESVIDNCLVEGINKSQGWGEIVNQQILPLLEHPKLNHHFTIIKNSLERFDQPISVFVVGEGKFGKSTLINALIGQGKEVAKTHFLPKTWHITRYVPSLVEERYEIYYNHQHEDTERFETICKNCAENIIIDSGLIKLSNLEQLQEILNLEEAEKKKSGGKSPIWQVLQTVPNDTLNITMEVVDTPGISQNRQGIVQEETIEDFYYRADIVLWVMIADKLNSRETNESLQSMSRYGKPIIGIINRADQIPEGKKELVIEQVQEKFANLLNDIVLLSAKQAFEGHKNSNTSLLEESGLPLLLSKIDYHVVKNGRRNQAISTYNTSIKAAEEAQTILIQEAENIEKNLEIYQQNLTYASSFKHETKVKLIIQGIVNETKQQIKQEAKKKMESTKNIQDEHLPLFDESAVKQVIKEIIKNNLLKMQNSLERELEAILEKIEVNKYQEQTYGATGYIKSYLDKVTVNIQNTDFLTNLNLDNLEIDFWEHFKLFLVNIGLGIKDGIKDFFEDVASWFWDDYNEQKRQARERERIKKIRNQELQANINNLENVAERCKQQITQAAESQVNTITDLLEKEVKNSFEKAFKSKIVMTAKAAQNRQNAARSFIPPVIIPTITEALQN